MSSRLLVPSLIALTCAHGCGGSPTASAVPLGAEFTLRMGERTAVSGTGFELRFEGVPRDSRCPSNAICIALGDAEAVFGVWRGGRADAGLSLHTTPGDGQRAIVGQWIVTLARLDPYPYAGRTIATSEYEALLRVDAAR